MKEVFISELCSDSYKNSIIDLFFCPEFCQFETVPQGSSCYDLDLFLNMGHDWETSSKKCSDVGMHLLTVEDEAENSWLNSYLKGAGLGDDVASVGIWLGYKG